jgi:hypothetical protein
MKNTTPKTHKGDQKDSHQMQAGTAGALLGIATIAAASAGAYFLYGSKSANKNRAHLKSWMIKMKGDVLEQLENLKEVNEEAYQNIIEKVSSRYKLLKKVDPTELMALRESLKGHWQDIKTEVDTTLKKVTKGMKNAETHLSSSHPSGTHAHKKMTKTTAKK